MKIAHYVKVVYLPNSVHVQFETNEGDDVFVFEKRRKSWSHKKYVDEALKLTGIKAGAFMSYGWDMTAI